VSREGNGSIKMTKFRLDNGNDLSVTYDSVQDRILYVEVDWNQAPSGKGTGISKLKFGETSLKDIRKRYRSNGFTHLKHASCWDDGELVMFNAFELKRTPTIILAFATRLPHESESLIKTLSPEKQVELISNYLMLESIVVADESYLDEIWGEDKSYDPLSKGIRL
jgi:hypothetical protein